MSARIATGLAAHDGGVDAFAEAAGRAALGLGGAPADLVAVFAGAANLDYAEEGLEAVADRLGARPLMGCGAQGVVGGGRELEDGGVVVWAARCLAARSRASTSRRCPRASRRSRSRACPSCAAPTP